MNKLTPTEADLAWAFLNRNKEKFTTYLRTYFFLGDEAETFVESIIEKLQEQTHEN